MKGLIISVLMFLCVSVSVFAKPISLTVEETEYIAANPSLKVGMLNDFNWFSHREGDSFVGYEHDLLSLISAESGLEFIKVIDTWPNIYSAFKNKKIDIISSISFKKSRLAFTRYTNPYYTIPVMVFIRDDFGPYKDLDSLKGRKTGVIRDVFYMTDLQEVDGLELVFYDSYTQLTAALVVGEVDALLQNLPTIDGIIKKNAYANIKVVQELVLPNMSREDLRFGVQVDNLVLRSILQKSLDNISPKTYKNLAHKWMSVSYDVGVDYQKIGIAFLIVLLLMLGVVFWVWRVKTNNKVLAKLAVTDTLTNLFNRRKIEELVGEEIVRCSGLAPSFVLVLVDIDHFKHVNDNYGHLVGDEVLVEFSSLLQNNLREADFVGRWGGEEFVIILPQTSIDNTVVAIEDIRKKIESYPFEKVGSRTASFGVTLFQNNDTLESLIKRADDALYQAKAEGRNKVVVNP